MILSDPELARLAASVEIEAGTDLARFFTRLMDKADQYAAGNKRLKADNKRLQAALAAQSPQFMTGDEIVAALTVLTEGVAARNALEADKWRTS